MEEVILETIYDDVVSVIPYDIDNKMIIGSSIEIIKREDARKKYEIVGEFIDGEIRIYTDEEDEDYSEFYQEKDEDESD